jgi:AcrR family transcriptional regulator
MRETTNDHPVPESRAKPRKEEILEVATRYFAERGYEGTSMNDVAESVGMRKASLFYHFATKDVLYEAVLDRLIETLGSALRSAYAGDGSFGERLETAADAATAVLGGHPYAARLLLRETMDWGPVVRGKLLGAISAVLEAGTAFVRAGQDAGEFVEGDARQLVLSSIGVHFLPFALSQLVERYAGVDAFDARFVADRRVAVRRHVRDMIGRR